MAVDERKRRRRDQRRRRYTTAVSWGLYHWWLRVCRCWSAGTRSQDESGTATYARPRHAPLTRAGAIRVRRGDTLHLGHVAKGCRGYLAVAGGIWVPPVLNSCSTYMAAKIGGYGGRSLQAGDQLAIGEPLVTSFSTTWSLANDVVPIPTSPCTLRILPEEPVSSAHRCSIKSFELGVAAARSNPQHAS